MADLTTNSQRARSFVATHIDCHRCESPAYPCAACADAAEKLERMLDESEDRGAEAASMLASRRPLQADKATVDALLDTIRESLAVLVSPASEVGLEAAIDARARNLTQAIIGNFEVRLLPADDVEAPSDEPTEPLRGPAR